MWKINLKKWPCVSTTKFPIPNPDPQSPIPNPKSRINESRINKSRPPNPNPKSRPPNPNPKSRPPIPNPKLTNPELTNPELTNPESQIIPLPLTFVIFRNNQFLHFYTFES